VISFVAGRDMPAGTARISTTKSEARFLDLLAKLRQAIAYDTLGPRSSDFLSMSSGTKAAI
jgi:hypothetical protein